ncbi:MAG TPA: hypothetical protein DCL21_02270 [Alphaproteobacteria bacterium]|nr:hypothetical protein [Alphaproteobacteria bacterium]
MKQVGAMFGLDARIALAIFGALSVISGAALYSAIQQVRVTSFITELKEIGKAWEAYYLDVGHELSGSGVNFQILQVQRLVENLGDAAWKGPYLPYKKGPNLNRNDLYHSVYSRVEIYKSPDNVNWNQWRDSGTQCAVGGNCFVWAVITNDDNSLESLAKNIDKEVDASDGDNTGDFRWGYDAFAKEYIYILKVALARRT